MTLAPIVLFTYNRPDHTRQTVEALQANTLASESELFIYSDAPKNDSAEAAVVAVRAYLKTVTGFKRITIIEREHNWGLADSIVDGVTKIINEYGRVIVLEDDIVTSPYFLQYMNDALELYKDEEQVMHVSGYFFPVDTAGLPETFFYNQTSCWGWGTWDRAWQHYRGEAATLLEEIKASGRLKEFDMDGQFRFSSTLRANAEGRLKTWAIKWYASVFLKNGFSLHPKYSLVKNIGNDGSGTNSKYSPNISRQNYYNKIIGVHEIPRTENLQARVIAIRFLQLLRPSLVQRLFNLVKYIK